MNNNITDTVKYIGVDDTDIDLFESQYIVPDGMCYNSYIVFSDKIAIIDTTDKNSIEKWEENLKKAILEKQPDYLVIQHMEPDHSSGILRAVELYPNITLVASSQAFKMLEQFAKLVPENKIEIKDGDTLDLGDRTLVFASAPMVHWPEVMVTYDTKEKILFSADGFGKFGTIDAKDDEGWACEARRYYFNICGKYGTQVQSLLKKAAKLDINIIAPLHGPILTENLSYYINLYDTWSSYTPEKKGILIACASIHGNTLNAAKILRDELLNMGEEKVVLSDLSREDMAEVIEDAFKLDRMILMSSSYDGGVFPIMHDFLHHLVIKGFQKRKIAIIENGTWAPSAGKAMKELVLQMKDIDLIEPVVTIKSSLNETTKNEMFALAKKMI